MRLTRARDCSAAGEGRRTTDDGGSSSVVRRPSSMKRPYAATSSAAKRSNIDFWKFWAGQKISNLGSSFTNFALLLPIFNLTGSALNLAIASQHGRAGCAGAPEPADDRPDADAPVLGRAADLDTVFRPGHSVQLPFALTPLGHAERYMTGSEQPIGESGSLLDEPR
ncbi:MAG: hypothetical protein ABIV47_21185 [Roseiflexaceae bacterium]